MSDCGKAHEGNCPLPPPHGTGKDKAGNPVEIGMSVPKWLATLIVGAVLSALTMVGGQGFLLYTAVQVTNERLGGLIERVERVDGRLGLLEGRTADRWTRTDHKEYAAAVSEDLENLGEEVSALRNDLNNAGNLRDSLDRRLLRIEAKVDALSRELKEDR